MRLIALALITFTPVACSNEREPPAQPRELTEIERYAAAFTTQPIDFFYVNPDGETSVAVLVGTDIIEARYTASLETISLKRNGGDVEGDPVQIDYVVRAAYTRIIQLQAIGAL